MREVVANGARMRVFLLIQTSLIFLGDTYFDFDILCFGDFV